MRWWGWGDDEHGGGLPDSADAFLREEIGAEPGEPSPHVPIEQVAAARAGPERKRP